MRLFKLAGMLFVLALAICAFASASASAALPEFLDGTVVGLTFTATIGEGEFVDPATGLAIKCKKTTVILENGKVTGAKTIELTLDLEGCTVAGIAANSLGDKGGVVLVTAKGELCYIGEASKKEVGMYFTITPAHIELPLLGELLELLKVASDNSPSAIARVTPINTLQTGPYTLNFEKPQIKECGGKKADILIELNHNAKPLLVEEVSKETVTFDKDIEVMA